MIGAVSVTVAVAESPALRVAKALAMTGQPRAIETMLEDWCSSERAILPRKGHTFRPCFKACSIVSRRIDEKNERKRSSRSRRRSRRRRILIEIQVDVGKEGALKIYWAGNKSLLIRIIAIDCHYYDENGDF